jgi:hypothetical protein
VLSAGGKQPRVRVQSAVPFLWGQNPGTLDQKIQHDAYAPVGSPNYDLVMQYINTEFAKAIAGQESVDAAIRAAAVKAHANAT